MKKILFGLAAALLLLGFTSCKGLLGTEEDSLYGWYGDGSASVFYIDSYNELSGLASIARGFMDGDVAIQDNFYEKTIILTADIELASWTPPGSIGTSENPFCGTFDGNNKTISGLTRGSVWDFTGLFGVLRPGGVVKNLVFDGATAYGNLGMGSVVYENKGTIQNIKIINGNLVDAAVGGIVYSNNGIVENCSFSGRIDGRGGGGIANSNGSGGLIRNCYVAGTITGSSVNTGGIVGNNSGIVENCYVTSSVTGDAKLGGISGSGGTVRNCVALNLSIEGTSTIARIALDSGKLTNNYARDGMTLPATITVTSDASGVHGEDVAAAVYQTQDFWEDTVGFNFTTVWEWDASKKLPVLR